MTEAIIVKNADGTEGVALVKYGVEQISFNGQPFRFDGERKSGNRVFKPVTMETK